MSAQRISKPDVVRLFHDGGLAGLSEWQLLQRFVSDRDELAFEAIVSRHGPMVLVACRRMLANPSDVEDAFQATFLVLLRRAGTLRTVDAIGPWLHGVAVKVAQQARSTLARRNRREQLGLVVDVAGPDPALGDPELRRILDEEIHRLPARYRLPIVLCYLEGRTHEQAARQLEWPLGTVKGRLARARALLETRLTRRGVAGAVATAALGAASTARAALPASLVQATCRTVAQFGRNASFNSAVATSVTRLVQGVLSTMALQKLKLIAAAAGVSCAFLTGVGVMARQHGQPAESPPEATPVVANEPAKLEPKNTPPKAEATDRSSGLSKPADAKDVYACAVQDARRAYLATEEELRSGKGSLDRVYLASRLLLQGETNAATSPADKAKALESHLDRMRKLARKQGENGSLDGADAANARAFAAEADLMLAQARTPQPDRGPSASAAASPGSRTDSRSQAILAKLEHPIAMSFPNETPLEEVLKYIKAASQGPNDSGIPIYVDPLALKDADKNLASPVQLDLEGIPLRRTLQLALSQLDLRYYVDDGILVITSQESGDDRLPPSSTEPSHFKLKQEKAERGEMSLEEMKRFVEELKLRKDMLNALTELQSINELGMRGGQGAPGGAETLLKEIKELVGHIKAEREKAAKGH